MLSFCIFATLSIAVLSTDYTFPIDVSTTIAKIPDTFYGFTIDWWTADDPKYGQKWGNAGALTVDFSNKNFIALTGAVSPAFLRIGGSPEDSIVYNISGECNYNYSLPQYSCSQTKNQYGCMNLTRWQEINTFAKQTNSTLLFGLNGCYGRPSANQSMNLSNIDALFTATQSIDHANLFGFELANELNSHIDASAYAADFISVRKMITNTFTNKQSPMPYLVGADVGSTDYSQQVINSIQAQTGSKDVSSIMNALTYHHYPNCEYPNHNETVFDLSCLESVHSLADSYSSIAKSGMTKAWMGEGSEHSGGGTPNVSNTFADCFYYLYQICEVITFDVPGTMRSDLIGGDYELIDKQTFLPNPDYWILYLLKQFVGDTVYNGNIGSGNARGYAFNGNSMSGKNSIVLALINFDLNENAVITLNVNGGDRKGYDAEEYHLKSSESILNSRYMMVNDVKMEYVNGEFPKLQGVKGDGKTVTLDPATLAFVVLTPQ